jgi:hypothetical protein
MYIKKEVAIKIHHMPSPAMFHDQYLHTRIHDQLCFFCTYAVPIKTLQSLENQHAKIARCIQQAPSVQIEGDHVCL